MAETRRKFDQDFQQGAVRLVLETGRPIAQVARDLGVNAGTRVIPLGVWESGSGPGPAVSITADLGVRRR